ncbi:MAG: hypothetical protein DME02_18520 [Candidatus Rokuibacteriota bacterium]|nr:MAG: hypothetical protein DME02_18520 [Candidatus Rokubacteria bacterium]
MVWIMLKAWAFDECLSPSCVGLTRWSRIRNNAVTFLLLRSLAFHQQRLTRRVPAMGINAISFFLGIGAAWLAPTIVRVLRPLAVEATAAGMGLFDDARRIAAEQLETLEDIAAEARARREAILAGTNGNGHHVELAEEEPDADETTAAPRRRGAARRRSS